MINGTGKKIDQVSEDLIFNFFTLLQVGFRLQSMRSTLTDGRCRQDTPQTRFFPWFKSLTGSGLCRPHKNKSHRHVIHVCTCAFFIILLLSIHTFDTHFLSLDYLIETNLPDNVAGSEHHCIVHTKRENSPLYFMDGHFVISRMRSWNHSF